MLPKVILQTIAKKFGTPTYVYEEGKILGQLKSLFQNISYRPLAVLYAMKANSNLCLLDLIHNFPLKEGEKIGVDAVSVGEIKLAFQRANFLPRHILFTGVNISEEDTDFAIRNKIKINVGSLPHLERIGRKYRGRRLEVCVRINTDIGAGHHDHCITGGHASKFGIHHTEIGNIIDIAKKYGLIITGVHQHIGSQILEVGTFLSAAKAILDVAAKLSDLQFVDFGGGFGVPYREEEKPLNMELLGRKLSHLFANFCKQQGTDLTMVIEPGRYVMAEAGSLLVKVTDVKRNPDGRIFVGVDSGFSHLIRPAMYKAYHQIVNISNLNGPEEIVDVVGNICESGDKFAEQRVLNQARVGDFLLIETAGAYGYSMASNYNLQPKPAEVLVKPNRSLVEIRRREDIDEMVKNA